MVIPTAEHYPCATYRPACDGRDGVPPWAPASGQIRTISLNTRADIDPKLDPLANPNFPNTPPWEPGVAWIHVTDYCGAVFAGDVGPHGTYMQYGAAGHAAVGACFWFGFDLADRLWKRVGRRPLPTDAFVAAALDPYNVGKYYPISQLDPEWGEWQGAYRGWPRGFAQPGYNPPEGSHTRNSFVYRPAAKAGNRGGQILVAWQPTGKNSGTNIGGGWVWDADTSFFSRHANHRPSGGGAVGGVQYFPELDAVVGLNQGSSSPVNYVDALDCATMSWVRRTIPSAPAAYYDSTSFAHGDYFVLCNHKLKPQNPPFDLWAIDARAIKKGLPASWVPLKVSATSYPVNETGLSCTVSWAYCPLNGCYYAVDRTHGSRKLWKMTPPGPAIAGTWSIAEEALGGEALDGRLANGRPGSSFDYSRLRWAGYLKSFLWTPDYVGGPVQAIRPPGV